MGPHPWQIVFRTLEDGTLEFKVELESYLYEGISDWKFVDVVGLDTWKAVVEGYVILEGTVAGGECTEAKIDGPIFSLPERVKYSNEFQSKFSANLGYLYEVEGAWFIRQNAFHNFTLFDTCIDGKRTIYPIST
jgi:hypothetical protein